MAALPKDQSCQVCAAWIDGVCRRHPPVYTSGAPTWEWPHTMPTDWCYEFVMHARERS